jgi:hypothetical protein
MPSSPGCDETRALAPELALGIADGRERAAALEHLSSCTDCRRFLAELAEVSDGLLALAPAREPPVGFESDVVATLGIGKQRRRWRLRWAAAIAGVTLVASAITAVALLAAFRDDRRLADQYRSALARVGGQYFQAARLRAADGTAVGKVFGYQGKPSWLVLIVYEPYRRGSFTGELVSKQGRHVAIPATELDPRQSVWGGVIKIDLRDVALVRLVSKKGEIFEGRLPPGPKR